MSLHPNNFRNLALPPMGGGGPFQTRTMQMFGAHKCVTMQFGIDASRKGREGRKEKGFFGLYETHCSVNGFIEGP